ncbi:hypothetical protein chiPu_0000506 [Chiloscyllium punctatum]|uniref:Uncharacterized protein n=1 Tax=Chiloscyllium punctatum TaxID=137246 RepID=A0A401RVG7_CHIPU|nr:hypothetical protein [Chiloscyllium punctatum]
MVYSKLGNVHLLSAHSDWPLIVVGTMADEKPKELEEGLQQEITSFSKTKLRETQTKVMMTLPDTAIIEAEKQAEKEAAEQK